MRLSARLIQRTRLTQQDRAAMLALMQTHYENVQPAVFFRDLAEKRWVIVVREPTGGRLCGFSTQTILEAECDGQLIRALFSGDTIIDREHWGDPALSHVWGQFALALIDRYDDAPLYWLLLSQGYRTYRFLPLFFHEFYPRHDAATPEGLERFLDTLAERRYGAAYDRKAGVVRAHAWQYRLRRGIADLSPERLRDEHVRYFAERNPGHDRGDELCCLAPLTRENFTRAAYRVIGQPEPALELT
ncbi:MAG TPA: hypothetical protein VFB80_02865 [Pirellulaceae bacterium]|nr:hypothetical protein [Pirellulaceae bacterium]